MTAPRVQIATLGATSPLDAQILEVIDLMKHIKDAAARLDPQSKVPRRSNDRRIAEALRSYLLHTDSNGST